MWFSIVVVIAAIDVVGALDSCRYVCLFFTRFCSGRRRPQADVDGLSVQLSHMDSPTKGTSCPLIVLSRFVCVFALLTVCLIRQNTHTHTHTHTLACYIDVVLP